VVGGGNSSHPSVSKLKWERHRRGAGGAALVRLGGGGSRMEAEQDRVARVMRWRSAGLAAGQL
jgi:hypothetical protein